ncbi:MAG: NUDIX hydrolase [Planctomycetota bacterium]
MHRNSLLQLLEVYVPEDDTDRAQRDRIVGFVRENPDCFERTLPIGHITGAAWLLDRSRSRVLLTHHRKLGRWLQLGGHADGDPNVLEVALREAREESGIGDIRPLSTAIFDVDVHPIPARDSEPQHFHYDIRFLLGVTDTEEFEVSEESHDLAWVAMSEVPNIDTDGSVLRMHRKWLNKSKVGCS